MRWQRPVLLTEIGYRNLVGAAIKPGDWKTGGVPDQSEQAACYEAAFRALWHQPWFAGFWWWDWSTDLGQAAAQFTNYMPANRLAGDVMKAWYGAGVSDA
jgi:hypothetical protein